MKNIIIVLNLILLVSLFSSCASFTMLSEKRKKIVRTVYIDGLPTNSKVFLNDNYVSATPCRLKIDRIYKKNNIRIEAPNYNSQDLKIKKKLRGFWFATDIFPGIVLLGIPLIIDFATGNIFKVDQDLIFKLSYSEEFYRNEYNSIVKSMEPSDYKNYIKKYPESICNLKAKDKIDSLEFITALNKNSETSLDEYVNTHGNSKFISEAQKIKTELYTARLAYENAQKLNTVQGYKDFLKQFPKSLHTKDIKSKLVEAGERDAFITGTSEAIYLYITEILNNYSESGSAKQQKFKKNIDKLQDLLIKEIITSNSNSYDSYSKLWQKTMDFQDKLNTFLTEITDSYRQKIYNELFKRLLQSNDAISQSELIINVPNDFPKLFQNIPNIGIDIIINAKNKSGVLKLFNNSYLKEKMVGSWTSRNTLTQDVKSKVQSNNNYSEEIMFSNDVLTGQQKGFYGIEPVFTIDINYGKLNGKACFYEGGKLIKTYFMSNENIDYFYEYKDGINLSLKSLDEKIKSGEKALNNKDYSEALQIFRSDCDNKYPTDIEQNKKLNILKLKAEKFKSDIEKKQEQKRLVKQKKQDEQDRSDENNQENLTSNYSSNSNSQTTQKISINSKDELYEHLIHGSFTLSNKDFRFQPSDGYIHGYNDDYKGTFKIYDASISGAFKITSVSSLYLYEITSYSSDDNMSKDLQNMSLRIDGNGNLVGSKTIIKYQSQK